MSPSTILFCTGGVHVMRSLSAAAQRVLGYYYHAVGYIRRRTAIIAALWSYQRAKLGPSPKSNGMPHAGHPWRILKPANPRRFA